MNRSPMRRQKYGGMPSDVPEDAYGRGFARDDASKAAADESGFSSGAFRVQAPPSSKAHGLVGEIVALETQCNWLEDRNSWLTSKLLQDRRKFIDRALMSNKLAVITEVFRAWFGIMGELRMEHQLDEQSRALHQCEQVTNELGQALAQEQDLRKEAEGQGRTLREENRRLLAENQSMRQQVEEQAARIHAIERQLQEADSCLGKSRSEALLVLELMEGYDSRRKDLGRDVRDAYAQGSPKLEEPIERSMRMRGEAQGTMRKAQQLLPSSSQGRLRPQSPERTAPPPGPAISTGSDPRHEDIGPASYGMGSAVDGGQRRARTPQSSGRPQQEPEPAEIRSRLQRWQQQPVVSEASASPSGMRAPSAERSQPPLRLQENVYGHSSGSAGAPAGAHEAQQAVPGSPSVQFRTAPQGFQPVVMQPSPLPGPVQPQMVRVPVMQQGPHGVQPMMGVPGVPGASQVPEPWWAARRAASPMRVTGPTL